MLGPVSIPCCLDCMEVLRLSSLVDPKEGDAKPCAAINITSMFEWKNTYNH